MLTSCHVMHVYAPGSNPEEGDVHNLRCTIGAPEPLPCALSLLQLVNRFWYMQGFETHTAFYERGKYRHPHITTLPQWQGMFMQTLAYIRRPMQHLDFGWISEASAWAQGVSLKLFFLDTFFLAKRVALLKEPAPVENVPGSASSGNFKGI